MAKGNIKKSLLQIALLILVFSFSVSVLWGVYRLVKPIVINLIPNTTDLGKILTTIISYVSGITNLIISTLVTAYVQSQIDIRLNAPQILITPKHTNKCNISGIKKERPTKSIDRIQIGKVQPKYRNIYATITNVGKGILAEYSIFDQSFSALLQPNDSCDICFMLYNINENDATDIMLPYIIKDVHSNTYSGSFCMQLNYSKMNVSFSSQQKIRKKRAK